MKVTKKLKFDISPFTDGNIWGTLALFCREAKDAGWSKLEIVSVANEVVKLADENDYEGAFKKLSSYCK